MNFAILAAISISSLPIFAKLAYGTGMSVEQLLQFRFGFSVPILLYLLYRKNGSLKIVAKNKQLSWIIKSIVIVSILFITVAICDFKAIKLLPVSIERMCLFTFPAVILVIELILGRTKLDLSIILLFITMYLGLMFVLELNFLKAGDQFEDRHSIYGIAWVLCASISYAIYLTYTKRVLEEVDSLTLTTYSYLIVFTAMFIFYSKLTNFSTQVTPKPTSSEITLLGLVYAIGISIFSTIIPYLAMFKAIKKIGSSLTGLILMISPVCSIIAAYIFLGQNISLVQASGCCLVLGAATALKTMNLSESA